MSALKKFRAEKSTTHVKDGIAAVRMKPTETNHYPLPANFTPLEQQVVNLRNHLPPNMLLVIMCGYKMKCFGRDARIVARRLGFQCIYPPNSPFEYCSFPVLRTVLHCSRLVAMGYHVGVVEQMESAAARTAEGSSASKLFERRLTKALSKASVPDFSSISVTGGGGAGGDDDDGEEEEGTDSFPNAAESLGSKAAQDEGNFILFIAETHTATELTFVSLASRMVAHKTIDKLQNSDPKFQEECIAALQSGLLCYAPVEIAYSCQGNGGDLSAPLASVISAVCRAHTGPSDDPASDECDVQLTRLDPELMEAYRRSIKERQGNADRNDESLLTNNTTTDKSAGPFATQPLMDVYFDFFQASDALKAAEIVPYLYRQEGTMHLPPTTLQALDVFPTRRNGSNSLFALVNRSMTSCGARRLRSWLAAPMCATQKIRERQRAIEAIATDAVNRKLLKAFLQQGQGADIEVTMTRLIAGRCSYSEYRSLLEKISALRSKAEALAMDYKVDDNATASDGPHYIEDLLSNLVSDSVLDALKQEGLYLKYDKDIALEEVYLKGLKPLPPTLQTEVSAIKEANEALDVELEAARAILKLPTLTYKTVALVTNLIEVPAEMESKVPKHWMVISRVKAATRYRTEEIVHQCAVRTAAKERLAASAQKYFIEHQKEVYSSQSGQVRAGILKSFSDFVDAVASLDALQSLAILANTPGYCLPTLVPQGSANRLSSSSASPSETTFSLKGLAHPMARAHQPSYVTCDMVFTHPSRLWLLTGPNMGGKSALMRSVALCSILGQVGAHVPATEASIPIFTSIWCRMGAHDDLLEGSSTFMMEMKETRDIITATDLSSSLVLMDELGRGTSSYDGVAVADAVLTHILSAGCYCMFVTHYHLLTDWHQHNVLLQLKYMSYAEQTEEEEATKNDRKRIVFLYQPVDGVTPSSFGINVAAMAGLPEEVLSVADRKSQEAERTHSSTRAIHILRRLKALQ